MNHELLTSKIKADLEAMLNEWRAGNIRWGAGTEFDQDVLESALEVISVERVADHINKWPDVDLSSMSAMDWAHILSEFAPPEFEDQGWFD